MRYYRQRGRRKKERNMKRNACPAGLSRVSCDRFGGNCDLISRFHDMLYYASCSQPYSRLYIFCIVGCWGQLPAPISLLWSALSPGQDCHLLISRLSKSCTTHWESSHMSLLRCLHALQGQRQLTSPSLTPQVTPHPSWMWRSCRDFGGDLLRLSRYVMRLLDRSVTAEAGYEGSIVVLIHICYTVDTPEKPSKPSSLVYMTHPIQALPDGPVSSGPLAMAFFRLNGRGPNTSFPESSYSRFAAMLVSVKWCERPFKGSLE